MAALLDTMASRDQATQSVDAPRLFKACRLAAAIALPVVMLASCTAYKAAVPPSKGHIDSDSVSTPEEKDRILPPLNTTIDVPAPKPRVKSTTYSVVVHDVPVKELLMALSRDTKENIDVHPGLKGLVSLNAIDETLPSILDRIAKQVNMRYRVEGRTIVVSPDSPFFKTYKVNYVNMTRDTTSTISVNGAVTSGGGGVTAPGGGTSTTSVTSTSKNNFWEVLKENVNAILNATRALSQSADDRQARAETARAAREERLAQAEAVARAGANASSLFDKAFGEQSNSTNEAKNEIVVNPVVGTVTVLGTERQHALVQQYLDGVQSSSQRQVLIEATIVEVGLSDTYQAGIDWSKVSASGFSIGQGLLGPIGTSAAISGLTVGYVNNNKGITASLQLLEQFGKTRVLSSPKLMALNNQTALLKVVENVVYFTIQSQISQSTGTAANNLQSTTTTPNTVAVGVVLSMTPQINEDGAVSLTVRPTITRISSFVQDPNPALAFSALGVPLNPPIKSQIPQIQVREMESVLQLVSGQIGVLGGLMQDDLSRTRDQIPGLGGIPRVGDLFAFRDEKVQKSELVIFLRPIIVKNPSLDSEELKHLRKFLPRIDQTGQNP